MDKPRKAQIVSSVSSKNRKGNLFKCLRNKITALMMTMCQADGHCCVFQFIKVFSCARIFAC